MKLAEFSGAAPEQSALAATQLFFGAGLVMAMKTRPHTKDLSTKGSLSSEAARPQSSPVSCSASRMVAAFASRTD